MEIGVWNDIDPCLQIRLGLNLRFHNWKLHWH